MLNGDSFGEWEKKTESKEKMTRLEFYPMIFQSGRKIWINGVI